MAAQPEPSSIEASGSIAVKTLLLTDLVDSTGLVERLGDQRASEVLALHDQCARELMVAHDAQEIDKADGFLLLFDRPIDGVRYALAYHRGLVELSGRLGVELEARCGLHLGEVFLRNNPADEVMRGAKAVEVEGLAKPSAARVMSLAIGRQTLLTRGAFDLARRAAVGDEDSEQPLRWLAHGAYMFKGLPEPVDVFEVGVAGFAPLIEPPDSDKARRSLAPGDEAVLGWRPAPGQQVPRRAHWALVEKLGEGGFGEVWLAAHEKTGEKRVFKFCFEIDRLQALQREVTLFRLLRETLGQREDIARILDWDFDEAPYFLESEYTAGGSLVDWAEQQGGIERVPLEVRLELVAQVAEALAAAHSVGVLHKDVKPANVLIATHLEGGPKSVLTDFGIGLITDRDLLEARGITSLGLTMAAAGDSSTSGTQLYKAPELLAGEAPTVQADIYALGILLYQVVVGDLERPLAPGWRRDVGDEILREDIAGFVDGSPRLRPRSVAEVAELLRTLDQRRTARIAERRNRVQAERRRRRRRLVAIVAAVSTVFLLVVTLLALQALRARGDAERRRQQAEELIEFMLFDLRENLDTIGRLDLLAQVARSSQQYFKSLVPEDESAGTAYQRGTTLLNIGDVLLDQGDTERALETYRAAQELFTASLATDPSRDEWQRGLGRSLSKIGRSLLRQGLQDEAFESLRGARAIAGRLAAREPEDRERQYELALAQYHLGDLEWRLRDYALAIESATAAKLVAERLTQDDEAPWRHRLLLIDIHTLSGKILRRSDPAAASVSLHQALDLSERMTAVDPTNSYWRRKMISAYFELGDLQLSQGQSDSALETFRKTSDGYRDLARQDPTRVYWQAGLAQSESQVAKIYAMRGELVAALEVYASALEIFTQLVADDPSQGHWQVWLAETHEHIGAIHLRRGEVAAAIEAYVAALPIRERRAAGDRGNPGRQNALSWNHLQTGKALALRGEQGPARRAWQRALEIIEPVTSRSDHRGFRDTQAQALMLLGRLDEARPVVEQLVSAGWDDAEFLELARRNALL